MMIMMPARLRGFGVVIVFSLVFVFRWVGDYWTIFMPKPSIYKSDIAADLSAQDFSEMNHSLPNETNNKNTTVGYQDHPKLESIMPIVNEERTQESRENEISLWESLWENSIPRHSYETKEIPVEKRQELWPQLKNQGNSSKPLQDLFAAFPLPKDSISLYNRNAYDRLVTSLLQAQRDGRNFTIVASGGSVTAGGGNPSVPQEHRFYSKFTDYLNTLLSSNQKESTQRPTVRWIGQGHGYRNSFHTAIFFDNFIPSDVDLLLWDFSINDADWDFNVNTTRDNILAWLSQVSRTNPVPPVIFIYQWDAPFHRDDLGQIVSRALDSHDGTLMRQFDFVVGHIDMAKYIDELDICPKSKGCRPLLSDQHHINAVGHMAVAFLLFNLMNPNTTLSSPSDINENKTMDDASYLWNCGVETKSKQVIMDAMMNSSMQWKGPLGAWTLELPASDQVTPRRLVASSVIKQIQNIGKQDPTRQDRQLCTPLYDCDESGNNSFSVITQLEPMKNVRVVLLTFRKFFLKTENLQLRLNGSTQPTKGELIPVRVAAKQDIYHLWRCNLAQAWGPTVDTYFYVFEAKQPTVHSIEVCAATRFTKFHYPKIQSLAVW